ncbi:histidinol-phosphate aminotransferase [Dysgonomonas alginatilytica]|uniref:Histidinol-phosphate aminotransferase n=1 Tax=Dysgonomonas alginatilytica TaxID=1605892 RepID=A0A2V3PPN5_9BACT|nr:aminotransferase class I/II-fold pyridoxal phosphate-dependent enzyme [Dysgonomonas alginatilytica]PXV63337.1 histidinol-phosphate aminotransferase [Dysgonomonas alginatilytica]
MSNSETKGLIYLDRNEYSYEVSPLVAKVLKEFNPQDLCTYTRCFQHGIKSELSQYIGDMYNVAEQNVVLGYGGEDILKGIIHCFLSQGHQQRKILIPTFSWWYYKSIADEVNGKTIMYPLYEDGYDFKYNIPEIKKIAEAENPDIVLLASPNNPTGNSLSVDEMKDIISSLGKDTIVVIDEAYTSFANKDITYISKLIKEFPNLLIIRTFSKFYGLPGLRLGYGFMGDGLKKFTNFSTMYLGYNKLTEKLGIAALQSTEYYNANAEKMQQDKELYKTGLNPIEGFKVYNSDANFVLVKYPTELKEKLQDEFKKDNIVVKFMNEEGLRTHMRITLGTTPINKQVVEIIRRVALNTNLK